MIRLLLRASPNSIISSTETADRLTPLHIAAASAKSVNAVLSPGHTEIFNLILFSSTVSNANMDPLSLATMEDSMGNTPIDYAWEKVEISIAQQNGGRKISVSEKYIHPLLKSEIQQHILISHSARNEMEGTTRSNSTNKESRLHSKSLRTPSSPLLLLPPVPGVRSTNDYLELRLKILQEKLKLYLSYDDDDDDDGSDVREGNDETTKIRNDDDDDCCSDLSDLDKVPSSIQYEVGRRSCDRGNDIEDDDISSIK